MISNPLYQQTITPVEQVNLAISNKLAQVHTVLPCTVVSVQYPKITVQPTIKRAYIDENQNTTYIPYGQLTAVPILTLGNSVFNINLPQPQPGDSGIIFVNEASVASVYNSGEIESTRKFSLLDSVFIPLFMNTSASPSDTMTINSNNINIVATTEAQINSPTLSVTTSTETEFNTPRFVVQGPIYELLTSIILTLEAIKAGNTVSGGPFDSTTISNIEAGIVQIGAFT